MKKSRHKLYQIVREENELKTSCGDRPKEIEKQR